MPELLPPEKETYYRWAQLQWQPIWFQEAEAWLNDVFQCQDQASPDINTSLTDLKESIECFAADLPWEDWRSWFAPLGAIEGCWLDTVVHMANAHTPVGALWLQAQSLVRRLFQACYPMYSFDGLSPVASHYGWLDKIHSDPVIWQDGATLLALGRTGGRYPWEILGLTQAYAQLGGGLFHLSNWLEKSSDAGDCASLAQTIDAIFSQCSLSNEEIQRVKRGKDFFLNRTNTWIQAWQAHWQHKQNLRQQVLSIFRQKARYAKGMHHRVEWQGRSLESWFLLLNEGNGERFLQAFLGSPFPNLEKPEDSRFFQHSITFEGPMFGVFSEHEIEIIKQWLINERRPFQTGAIFSGSGATPLTNTAIVVTRKAASELVESSSVPKLYLDLLQQDNLARSLPMARSYVRKILSIAQRKARRTQFDYSPERLKETIEIRHQRQCRSEPQPPSAPKISREAYIWGIEQLAPAILMDGAWLQYSALVSQRYPAIGNHLWAIFRDELGAGKVAQNHANVYRKLLAELSIELPPFDSEAFINHPGFIKGAFDLPAFLLAIGQLPGEFLPEILGLNLAIELNGLGETYQTLAEELTYWGIDPTIIRLHQSIDNLASGHAAWAQDAIIAYLDTFACAGEPVVQAQWLRVWTGYHALHAATRRFVWRMIAGWWWRFGWPSKLKNRILPSNPGLGCGG